MIGNQKIVIVDNYFKENARVFDMLVEVTDEVREKYPLYSYFQKHGIKIIHWWAAVMGCGVSKDVSRIRDAMVKAFLSAIASFISNDTQLLSSR